jgi:hypothetical protein
LKRLLWIVSLAFVVRWAAIEVASHLARRRPTKGQTSV